MRRARWRGRDWGITVAGVGIIALGAVQLGLNVPDVSAGWVVASIILACANGVAHFSNRTLARILEIQSGRISLMSDRLDTVLDELRSMDKGYG